MSLYEIFRFSFVEGIARIGVPLFFFISGFLFFYYDDFSKNVYLGKIKKRFKSLVVPYIFWNLVVVGFYFMAQMVVPSMMSGQMKLVADFTMSDWLSCFWNFKDGGPPVNLPLWFLRDLICLSIGTPLICLFVKMCRIYGVVLLAACWLIFGTPTNFLVGLFFFTAGAWFGINKVDVVEKVLPYRKMLAAAYFLVMIAGIAMLLAGFPSGEYLHKLGILFGLGACFAWAGWIVKTKNIRRRAWLEDSSFLVYAYHGLPLLFLSKICVRYIQPESSAMLIFLFVVLPVVIGAVGVAIYAVMKKFFPCFTSWTCGK